MIVQTRDGRQFAIECKWAGEGWPDDVRRVARDAPEPWPANLVLLARDLSPGAIEWLRARGANWADEMGRARILGPDGLLVIREPARGATGARAQSAFSWSPSALSIAEAILALPDEPLRTAALAGVCGWSTAQTASVLKALDGQGWTAKLGAARGPSAYRELVDGSAMLAAWSAAVDGQIRDTRTAHRATTDVMALLRGKLAPALGRGVRWAVSGWAGLELAAPFATTTPALHVYVADRDFAGRLSSAIEDAGLSEVDEGGRVTFWRADHRVFKLAGERDGLPVVSAPRLYADLSSFGARGQDAADHVRDELIDPLHPASMGQAPNAGRPEWE
ncbi:MAG: type IV toxin-antitoxin system AbiEi family antitoxin [Solirubrobacteraceae bacterium]